MKRVIARKIYHLCAGLVIPLLYSFYEKFPIFIFALSLTGISVIGEIIRWRYPKINKFLIEKFWLHIKEKEVSKITGHTYMLISSCLVILLFEKHIAILSLIYLAVGDVFASVIGINYGRRMLFKKTVEGFFGGLVTSTICAVLYWNITGFPLNVGIAGAISAALIEVLPLPIDDNLIVPFFSALVMAGMYEYH